MPEADLKYVRVYYSIVNDDRFAEIYHDARHLGTWLQLLLVADAMYPADAPLPAYVHRASVKVLVDAGLVENRAHQHFRLHGLASERDKRSQSGRNAAAKRWDSERNADPMPRRDEQRRAETRRAETSIAREDWDGRSDLEAFVAVRRRVPTPAQRAFMDAYCETFDLTGPDRAARLIWANPDDPIGSMKEDIAAFREERRTEAIAAEVPKPRRRKGSGMSSITEELATFFESQKATQETQP